MPRKKEETNRKKTSHNPGTKSPLPKSGEKKPPRKRNRDKEKKRRTAAKKSKKSKSQAHSTSTSNVSTLYPFLLVLKTYIFLKDI
jgi:hypothetical protein